MVRRSVVSLCGVSMAAVAFLAGNSVAVAAPLLVDDFSNTDPNNWPLATTRTQNNVVAGDSTGISVLLTRVVTLSAISSRNTIFQPSVGIYQPDGSDHNVFEFASPTNFSARTSVEYSLPAGAFNVVDNIKSFVGLSVVFDSYDYPNRTPLSADARLFDNVVTVINTPSAQLDATSGPLFIPFGDGAVPDGFTLRNLRINFSPPAGADFRISSITLVDRKFVPEPGAVGLLVPLAGTMLRRRRA